MIFGPAPSDQERTREFLKQIGPDAFRKRVLIGGTSAVVAVVVLVGWGVTGGHLAQAINASALILDIGGASLLVVGLLMSKEMIGAMGAVPLGGNDAPRLYWEATRKDAAVALSLLVGGFIGQIVADVMR